MYFIEVILKKIFHNNKNKETENIPTFENTTSAENEECDEHVFMPVDSTGEILSCINCGLVVHKDRLHNQNPF